VSLANRLHLALTAEPLPLTGVTLRELLAAHKADRRQRARRRWLRERIARLVRRAQ
jgi:hypothetical protein